MADINPKVCQQIVDDIFAGRDILLSAKADLHLKYLIAHGYLLKTPETTPMVRLTKSGTTAALRTGYLEKRIRADLASRLPESKGSYGDMGVPGDNHFDPSKRGFQPR